MSYSLRISFILMALLASANASAVSPISCLFSFSDIEALIPQIRSDRPRERILSVLGGEVQRRYEAQDPTGAVAAMMTVLADTGYQVIYRTHVIRREDLRDPLKVDALIASLHGGFQPSQPGAGGHPHDIRMPQVLVEQDGRRFSLAAILKGEEATAVTPALLRIARRVYQIAHEETYHGTQYDGARLPRGPFLPFTEQLKANRNQMVENWIDHYDLPAHTLLMEVDYLEYQLTRHSGTPFETASDFERFMNGWGEARWGALRYFESLPGFNAALSPAMRTILGAASRPSP